MSDPKATQSPDLKTTYEKPLMATLDVWKRFQSLSDVKVRWHPGSLDIVASTVCAGFVSGLRDSSYEVSSLMDMLGMEVRHVTSSVGRGRRKLTISVVPLREEDGAWKPL